MTTGHGPEPMLALALRLWPGKRFTERRFTAMIGSMTYVAGRIGKRDIAIATVLSLLGLLLMYANVADDAGNSYKTDPDGGAAVHIGNLLPYELTIPLFLLITVPLLWRRVAPIPALGAAVAGLLVNEALIGTEVVRCGVLLPTAFIFAFTTGAQLEGRKTGIGLGLSLALVVIEIPFELGPAVAAVMAGITLAMWGIGRLAHSRVRMADELRARTQELRHTRDERARLEVTADRTKLSGELDTLLQRRLGELARLADAGAATGNMASASATLADIERESRRTLEDMREVVGALRSDGGSAAVDPQPTLTSLEALLVRAKGSDAHLTVTGSPRVLPAGVELSAYRVVEHLLDAIEDAPGVDVEVRFADDALELSVSGPARRRADAGSAIERARQRVRLHNGTLDAVTRGGRAQATAHLPVLSGAAAAEMA
jgi:hypothetical protein